MSASVLVGQSTEICTDFGAPGFIPSGDDCRVYQDLNTGRLYRYDEVDKEWSLDIEPDPKELRYLLNHDSLIQDTTLELFDRVLLANGAIYRITADSISGLPVDTNLVIPLDNGLYAQYNIDEYVNVDHLRKTREEDINDALQYVETGRSNRGIYIEGGSFDPGQLVLPNPGSKEIRILVHGEIRLDTTLVLGGKYHLFGVGSYSNDVQFAHFDTGAELVGDADNCAVVAFVSSSSNSIKNISINAFGGTNKTGLVIYDSPSVVLEEVAVNHQYIGIQVTNSYWIYANKVTTRATTGDGIYGIHFVDDRSISSNVCHLQFWRNITMKGPCIWMEPRSNFNMNSINFENISTEIKNTPVVTFDVTTAGRIFNCTFKNIHTADDAAPFPIFKVEGSNRSQEVNRIYISNIKNSDNTPLVEGHLWNSTIVNSNRSAIGNSIGTEINYGVVGRDRASDYRLTPTYQLPGEMLFFTNDTSDLSFLARDASLGVVTGPDGVYGSAFSVTNVETASQVRAWANGSYAYPDEHYLVLGGWFRNTENAFPFKIRSLVSGFVTETGDSIAVDEKSNVGLGPITGNGWQFMTTTLKVVNPGNASGTTWIEVSNSSTGDTTYGEYYNLFGLLLPDSMYTSSEIDYLTKGLSMQDSRLFRGVVGTNFPFQTGGSLYVGDSLVVTGGVQLAGLSEQPGTKQLVLNEDNQLGYKTAAETKYGCTVLGESNQTWITHTFTEAPLYVELYPRGDIGSYWVDSITNTQFKLNTSTINPTTEVCWVAVKEDEQVDAIYEEILTEYGGSSVSEERQRDDKRHIRMLLNLGIWDNLDAYYMFRHENDTLAKINWINPGYKPITVNGASWSTGGYDTRGGGWISTGIQGDEDLTNFKQGNNAALDFNAGWAAYSFSTTPEGQIAGFDDNTFVTKRNFQDRLTIGIFSGLTSDANFGSGSIQGVTQLKRRQNLLTIFTGNSGNVSTRNNTGYVQSTGAFTLGDADTTADESTGALFRMFYLGGGLSTADMIAFETEFLRYQSDLAAPPAQVKIEQHSADFIQLNGFGSGVKTAVASSLTPGNLLAVTQEEYVVDYPLVNPYTGGNQLTDIIDSVYNHRHFTVDTVVINFQKVIGAIADTIQEPMWIVPSHLDGDTIIGFRFMLGTKLSVASDMSVQIMKGGFGGDTWFTQAFTPTDQFKGGYLPVVAGMPLVADEQHDLRVDGFTSGPGMANNLTVQYFIRRKKTID